MNANKIHRLTIVDRQHRVYLLKKAQKAQSYGVRNNSIRVSNVLSLNQDRKVA